MGCALCTIYSPRTLVSIDVNADDKKIKDAKVLWVLNKEFSEQLKQIYDLNQNNILDKTELKPIEQSMLDYLVPNDFLIHISYDKVINKENSLKVNVKQYKAHIKNSLLHFEYFIDLNYDVIDDNILYFKVNDEGNYFLLELAKDSQKFNANFNVSKVSNTQDIAFYIKTSAQNINYKEEKKIEKSDSIQKEDKQSLLSEFAKKVKAYLLKVSQGDFLAMFSLLFISFIYGVIHALGPGHGKSLAFTYFISNKSSFIKAFIISQATAFIHILGALILVIISVFLLQSVFNNFVNDSVELLTKVSAVMIVVLAIYILSNKLRHKDCSCSSCCSSNDSLSSWSTNKPKSVNNLKPSFMKKDIYFVLTAGLIPCPGTVILFIYAFVLKTYLAVFLASIAISLGMGLIIFISSFLGVSLNKVSQKSKMLIGFFEILSPLVMLLLGVLLYLNAQYV